MISDINGNNTGDGVKIVFKLDGKEMGLLLDSSLLKELRDSDISVPVVADKRALAALDKLTKRYNLKEYSKTIEE